MKKPNWEKLFQNELDWKIFQTRHALLQKIRAFFINKGYLEIDAPHLTPFPSLDPHIRSIPVQVYLENEKILSLFLHTSPEHAMKKLLVAGAGNCFFLGKVFRNGERTRFHNPEFTLLEWYTKAITLNDLIHDTEQLVYEMILQFFPKPFLEYQGQIIDLTLPWPRITIQELFTQKTGVPFDLQIDLEGLKTLASRLNIYFSPEDNWETLFFRIFIEKIEPGLGFPKPVFITEYPLELGLMAKRNEKNPSVVDRAELYIGGIELANGYCELTDPEEQEARFNNEQNKKVREYRGHWPIDEELLDALKKGLPLCAGMALGFDRLLMLITNAPSIQDVLWFSMHEWSE